MTSTAPIIDVRGLTKRFGDRIVVDRFDMQVPQGRIYGFLGPNGSGKTTTLRMLCGLLRADAGEGTCLGYDIRRESHLIKRQVGYMTQKFGLYEDLSIAENLDFIARVFEVPARQQAVEATLMQLGLGERRHQLAGTLSGGWKQRLALASCLLHAPQLLLLDEPTAGVDPKARREFWDQIHDLAAAGLTVLVTTHYMDEAERCHELAYISEGRLLARGTPAELIAGAGLATCAVAAIDPARDPAQLSALAQRLRALPMLRSVASFGATLHVSASSQAALDAALASVADQHLKLTAIEPSLEDVFIVLMQDSQGNPSRTAA
ncbi:MAG: ABC transporter ATP-binding protein [Oxalobacteraceae bacterium]|nr:ABC transporter ATP-binding protein [Oxalobacteraceae bacterium]